MTPLLARIEQQIAVCNDPLQEAELLAERACYFARTGDFAGANAIVASLRQAYGDGRSVRISVWIMLVEGLILYFDQTDMAARDRLFRASALSSAASLHDLRVLTAVWLAHIEFNRSDFDSMLRLLRGVTQSRGDWGEASVIRFNLLIADSYMYCGQAQVASRWYRQARLAAVNYGDQASIAALIYNKSALALAHIRIESAMGRLDISSLRFILLEIESAYSFHVGTAHASLLQLIETCRARALFMEGRFDEARVAFESLLTRSKLALGLKSDRIVLELEYAQCLHQLGLELEARECFLRIDPEEYRQLTIDDQLVFLVSYVSVGEALSFQGRTAAYVVQVEDLGDRYRAGIVSLKADLDDLCIGLLA